MTHTYQITGMTCSGCESAVKDKLLRLPEVTAAEVSKDSGTATITMDSHLTIPQLQEALGGDSGKYKIAGEVSTFAKASADKAVDNLQLAEEMSKSWVETYKPILLIFGYVTLVSGIAAWRDNTLDAAIFMRVFMAGFFLTFSFFKLLNINAFADSYAMYDIVAKKIRAWGFIYVFIELGLGIAFACDFEPVITNWITLVVMSVSIIGVLQSVFNKQKIRCACLGTVFNLPMSTVTIIEDALMIAMSAAMLFMI